MQLPAGGDGGRAGEEHAGLGAQCGAQGIFVLKADVKVFEEHEVN